ncbi:MAG TPA: MaoC family dehydratase [Acholeplasmataceae bacterium]|nr:MaoC family dehydratase [Acholeplasmataceae bacterium]HRX44928.1 MaoC family dehydratase [Acholeplasmataceae bacterium]
MIKYFNLGEQKSYDRVITSNDIKLFGEVTGDYNLAHFDEDYCAKTVFKKPIVHGMLIGSLFSKVFGSEYPGGGMIYCSQTLKFLKPVYPNTTLKVVITTKDIIPEKNRVIFTTEVFNENNECAVTGEAMLMPRKEDHV